MGAPAFAAVEDGRSLLGFRMCLTPEEQKVWWVLNEVADERRKKYPERRHYDVALPEDDDGIDSFAEERGLDSTTTNLVIEKWEKVRLLARRGETSNNQAIYDFPRDLSQRRIRIVPIPSREILQVPVKSRELLELLVEEIYSKSSKIAFDVDTWLRQMAPGHLWHSDIDANQFKNQFVLPVGGEFGWRLLSRDESSGQLSSYVPGFAEVELEVLPRELETPSVPRWSVNVDDDVELMPRQPTMTELKTARRRRLGADSNRETSSAGVIGTQSEKESQELIEDLQVGIEQLLALEKECALTFQALVEERERRTREERRQHLRASILEATRRKHLRS